jgi:hypothetical protein
MSWRQQIVLVGVLGSPGCGGDGPVSEVTEAATGSQTSTGVVDPTADDVTVTDASGSSASTSTSAGTSTSGADSTGGTATPTGSTAAESSTGEPDACVADDPGLLWPIACEPGADCWVGIGYPDIDGDDLAYDCSAPNYQGHEGSDLDITVAAMNEGVEVLAAADAVVVFVRDDKYDRCDIEPQHPDCVAPVPPEWGEPGQSNGHRVCTDLAAEHCNADAVPGDMCFWCFDGGNLVILRHTDGGAVFATRYDHIRTGSAMVAEGDVVTAGQPSALVGSAGRSTSPHLHFEVWDQGGWYSLTEPWCGPCSPKDHDGYLFASDPPWAR